jgi:hypothetical protein
VDTEAWNRRFWVRATAHFRVNVNDDLLRGLVSNRATFSSLHMCVLISWPGVASGLGRAVKRNGRDEHTIRNTTY